MSTSSMFGCLSVASLVLKSLAFADAPPAPLLNQYDDLMKKYPAQGETLRECVTPKFRANHDTNKYHKEFGAIFSKLAVKPNFCGRYYLFNEPITGGGAAYFSDCASGKVETFREGFSSDHPYSKVESCLFIEHVPAAGETADHFTESAYGPPRLYQWNGQKFGTVPDTIWPKKK